MPSTTRSVKAKVELDGEQEYKRALSELNAGNSALRSEMTKLKAEFKGQTESTEYLTKAGDLLQRQLLQQQDKIKLLKEALQESAEKYGEADKRTQDWVVKLNNAEAAEASLKKSIEETDDALIIAESGIKEYTKALEQINDDTRVLDSEMEKLRAGYKDQTDSAEYLTKSNELLNKELQTQREKISTIRDAIDAATEAYGKQSKQVKDLTVQLNQAETEEIKIKQAIEENNQALENQGNVMNTLADSVTGLADSLGIKLPPGADRALDAMRSFSNGSVAAIGLIGAAIAAVDKAMKALTENAVKYAAEADEILTKSAVTGLSTTLIQELQYAESMIDVSVDTITGSLTKLTTNMADAAGGNDKLAASFAALGISIDDGTGHLRDSEDVFFEIVDALGQMGNDTERDALAMDLLGKSAQDLNPLIKQGTGALKEYMAAADENFVLTEDQIAALGDLDDQVEKNRLEWEALKKQLAAEFAPAAKKVMESFGKLVTGAGEALIESRLIDSIGNMLKLLTDMISPILKLFAKADEAPSKLSPVAEALRIVAYVLATIQDAISVIVGLLPSNWGSGMLTTALGWNINKGQMSATQRVYYGNPGSYGNTYDEELGGWTGNYGKNAGGSDSWRGGLTWVGEAGPELVALPQGSQIYSNQDSRQLGGDTFYITIDAASVKEFNDIVEMAQSARVRARMR